MTTNIKDLAEAIVKEIKEEHHTFWIDPEAHSEQHAFISLLMKEREEKIARRKRVEEKIAGSLIITAVLAFISLVGAGALEWIKGSIK